MNKPVKIIITREMVLDAFTEGRTFAHRPLGITDIARNIAEERDAWDDPFKVMSRATLNRLLDEMTRSGALVVRTGSEWWSTYGVDWYDRRPSTRYWTTQELAEQWASGRAEEKRAAEEKKRTAEADQYAKGMLVERHRAEYDRYVAEFFAELKEEQGR